MGKVLIIGAGCLATVAAHKLAQHPEVFSEFMIASRTRSKCDAIALELKKRYQVEVPTAQVDADNVPELVELFSYLRASFQAPVKNIPTVISYLSSNVDWQTQQCCWIF